MWIERNLRRMSRCAFVNISKKIENASENKLFIE